MEGLRFNPKWLLLLAAAGVSLVAFNGLFPGAGVAIAAAIALYWMLDTGAVDFISTGAKRLRKAAAL